MLEDESARFQAMHAPCSPPKSVDWDLESKEGVEDDDTIGRRDEYFECFIASSDVPFPHSHDRTFSQHLITTREFSACWADLYSQLAMGTGQLKISAMNTQGQFRHYIVLSFWQYALTGQSGKTKEG